MTEEERESFEAHFSKPPFEWEFHRYGEQSAWPGNYRVYEHRCAWDAWQARAALPQPQETTPAAAAQPLEGYVMVPVETLRDWKSRVNTIAALSLKAERYQVGVSLKQEIADVISAAPPTRSSAPGSRLPGLLAAAAYLEGRASGYIQTHAYEDPDTGGLVFDRGEGGRDYHSNLIGLAEDIRALATQPGMQHATFGHATQPQEAAPSQDAEDAAHIANLIEVARMPNAEYVADAHNDAVKHLRARAQQEKL